jgi:hypothetical protein
MRTLFTIIAAALFVIAQAALAQPTITSVTPQTGKVGRTVTITGTGFDTTPANNKVYFGAVSVPVLKASTTSLQVNAPAQATYRPVAVTKSSLTGYSGKPFIVTFNPNATVTTGSFGNREDLTVGSGAQASAISDFDGDGKPDLATICYNTNRLATYLNTSTLGVINFRTVEDDGIGPIMDTTGVSPSEIAVADMDGDGLPDLVITSFDTTIFRRSTVSVFRNTSSVGSISFAPRVDDSVGVSATGVDVADLDGDGKPDVVAANLSSGSISFLRNNSTPGHVVLDSVLTIGSLGLPHSIAIGDLDNDGKPDIAVTNSDLREVTIFPNASTPGTIAVGTPTHVAFYIGTTAVPESLVVAQFVALGDLDGDGKADMAVVDTVTVRPQVFVLRNTSSGTGTFSFDTPVRLARSVGIGAASIADISGDGRPDIVVGNSLVNTVSFFQNASTPGSLAFASKDDIDVTSYPIRIAVGDFDGDGHPDLAAPGFLSTDVSVVQNLVPNNYVRANIKAILQGPFSATVDSMARSLNTSGVLTSHFGAGKFPALAVDSINIEVRNNSTAAGSTIRRFAPAWLLTNGTIRNFTDTVKTFVDFDTVAAGSYYLVVRHRNHLAIMTNATTGLTSSASPTMYDYTTGQNRAFGTNPMIQVGTRFCMSAGDGNGSGIVTTADANAVFNGINGTGYLGADGNLSGIVTVSDANIVFTNLNASTKVP